MIDLQQLKADLQSLHRECGELGVSKTIADRVHAVAIVLEVVERERQKRGAS